MEAKENNKKNRIIVYALIGAICLGVSAMCYFIPDKPKEPVKKVAVQAVKHLDTCTATAPDPTPVPAPKPAPKATAKRRAVKPKPSGLTDEIAMLNDDNTVAFDNTFADGMVSKCPLTDYYRKTSTGYELDMHGASFLTTPTVCDSSVYVSGGFSSRAFYAFNTNSGRLKWAAGLSDDGPSSCVIVDSLVIFNTESCTVFALNRYNGKLAWAKWIGDPLLTHLATDGDCIYTAYPSMTFELTPDKLNQFTHIKPSHAIAAMKAKTGTVKWQRWLDGDIMTTPVVYGDDIYLTTFSGTLYKIRRSDGKILAAANMNATTLPTMCKGKLYMARQITEQNTIKESIVEVDADNLEILRTLTTQDAPYLDYTLTSKSKHRQDCQEMDSRNGFSAMPLRTGWAKASKLIGQSNVSSLQNYLGSTMIAEGQKLYSCYGGRIICIDADNGNTIWSYELPGDINTSGGALATAPVISGGYIVSVTQKGEVLMLDKKTGKEEHTYATKKSVRNQPIIRGSQIFVPTEEGKLVMINTKLTGLTDWSMFMKNNAHNIGD